MHRAISYLVDPRNIFHHVGVAVTGLVLAAIVGQTVARLRDSTTTMPTTTTGWAANPSALAVVHLTDDTAAEFIRTTPRALLLMYAPWCGHCRAMHPAYARAAEIQNPAVVLAAIDCDANPVTCQTYGVRSYPTLVYYARGLVTPTDLPGRDTESLARFARNGPDYHGE